MMNSFDEIIIFTQGFPFGKSEIFLETEITTLSTVFKKVTIVSKVEVPLDKREVPKNCEVIVLNNKRVSVWHLFKLINVEICKEFWSILFQKNFYKKLRELVSQLLKSYGSYLFIKNRVSSTSKCVVYSYWLDESSLSFSFICDKLPNSLFVSRAHAWDLYQERNRWGYLPLKSFIAKKMSGIFFISNHGIDYFRNTYEVNVQRLFLSRLGTKKSMNYQGLPPINNSDTLHIVSCSVIIPIKRLSLIIEALSILPVRYSWTHIGFGECQDAILAEAKSKLDNNSFTFLGYLKNESVLEYYKSNKIDFLLNTSTTEGVPVSMMEAMSCGIPCIGTNVGAVSEIIEDNKNGFLMTANPTPKEVSSFIMRYKKLSTSEKQKMKNNAYKTWENKFNAEKNYSDFISRVLQL